MRIRSLSKKHSLRFVTLGLFVVFVLISGLLLINKNERASAVSVQDFKAGNIISDYVFYNKDAMNVQQIQNFLNGLIPNCLTWNNRTFVDGSGATVGPPYVCLNNYHENPATGETSFEKGGGAFPGGISAAQIIYNAAQQYNINPQVLLVMLKKESLGPLTSDTWPTKYQYRYAMGYACPDSGANNSANCNAEKAGFYKQVTLAAWQFNYYKEHPNDYRYRIGWNDIQYSPTVACGTKRVYIENLATLSLYIYTPYTPNDAALANYPGTANCGAYGNRNFFMFFSGWFGSTQGIEIRGSIKTKYDAINGKSLLGDPLQAEQGDGTGFWWQRFANGHIVGSARTGYYVSKGSIRAKWAELGYQNGQLKLPTSDETYDAKNNLWSQSYEGGEIKTHSSGAYRVAIKGSIYAAYGDFNTKYTVPMEDETGDGTGLWWQKFSNGYIIGKVSDGYFESTGSIRNKWAESGYQSSPVGIPTGNITETSPNCYSQTYTKGVIKGCSGKYEIVLNPATN